MPRFWLPFVAAYCLSPASLFAHQFGDRVMVTATLEAKLMAGNTVVATVPRGNDLRVDDVNGDWLWVSWMGEKGWVHRREVMTLDNALDFFTAAIRKSPTSDDYQIRGRIWFAKHEYDIALSDINESIRLDPRDASAYNARGEVWRHKRDYDKALADYNEALRLDPSLIFAYNNRGIVWKVKGEYAKSIADYNEAIRLNPKYATPYNNKAFLLASCSDSEYRDGKTAVDLATRACELDGWQKATIIDTLAAAYAEAGDFESAVKWQSQAVELAAETEKDDFGSRLELYKSGKPYRQDAATLP